VQLPSTQTNDAPQLVPFVTGVYWQLPFTSAPPV
jgi:hypothetical protein